MHDRVNLDAKRLSTPSRVTWVVPFARGSGLLITGLSLRLSSLGFFVHLKSNGDFFNTLREILLNDIDGNAVEYIGSSRS